MSVQQKESGENPLAPDGLAEKAREIGASVQDVAGLALGEQIPRLEAAHQSLEQILAQAEKR